MQTREHVKCACSARSLRDQRGTANGLARCDGIASDIMRSDHAEKYSLPSFLENEPNSIRCSLTLCQFTRTKGETLIPERSEIYRSLPQA